MFLLCKYYTIQQLFSSSCFACRSFGPPRLKICQSYWKFIGPVFLLTLFIVSQQCCLQNLLVLIPSIGLYFWIDQKHMFPIKRISKWSEMPIGHWDCQYMLNCWTLTIFWWSGPTTPTIFDGKLRYKTTEIDTQLNGSHTSTIKLIPEVASQNASQININIVKYYDSVHLILRTTPTIFQNSYTNPQKSAHNWKWSSKKLIS